LFSSFPICSLYRPTEPPRTPKDTSTSHRDLQLRLHPPAVPPPSQHQFTAKDQRRWHKDAWTMTEGKNTVLLLPRHGRTSDSERRSRSIAVSKLSRVVEEGLFHSPSVSLTLARVSSLSSYSRARSTTDWSRSGTSTALFLATFFFPSLERSLQAPPTKPSPFQHIAPYVHRTPHSATRDRDLDLGRPPLLPKLFSDVALPRRERVPVEYAGGDVDALLPSPSDADPTRRDVLARMRPAEEEMRPACCAVSSSSLDDAEPSSYESELEYC
jgi:hypothetical protein